MLSVWKHAIKRKNAATDEVKGESLSQHNQVFIKIYFFAKVTSTKLQH